MIELKGVSYAYPSVDGSAPESIHDIDFALNAGELVAVVGANGAGKSTLGRVLCGTFAPSAGEVLNDGAPLEGEALHQLVAYVRQDPISQLVSPTVFDEVAFGPCNLGLPEAEVLERINWALDAVGLGGYKERLVSELSGGELQRLALAGVLAMKPRYIVMDEVTSQLDYASREQLREIVAEQVASGTGVLSIAHDAIEVAKANRVVLVESGTIAWQGSPAEFFSSEGLTKRACMSLPQKPSFTQIPPQIPTPKLLLEDVCVTYETTCALKVDSLALNQGRILLVAGRSGSGKSTLAHVCSGLLEPETGTVLLDGKPVKVGRVGLCMQRPEAQLFCDTVLDDVAFGPKNKGAATTEAQEQAQSALKAFEVSEQLWSASPFALSGGQRRRVALAGITALGTDVILFDEPTVGLDAAGSAALKDMIVKLAQGGKSIVVVSHDIDVWLDVAHEVALLDRGMLIWTGVPSEMQAYSEVFAKAGFATPAWRQMSEELERLGVGAKGGVAHE